MSAVIDRKTFWIAAFWQGRGAGIADDAARIIAVEDGDVGMAVKENVETDFWRRH